MSYINKEGNVRVGKIVLHSVLVLLALILFFGTVGTISAGEKGVLLQWGAVTGKVYDAGLFFKVPIMQQVQHMNVRIQKEQVGAQAASKDLQTVSSQIALNYHLQPDKVTNLWQTIGGEYKSVIIDPAIQEAMKAGTAKYTAEELIGKRAEVKENIKVALIERLAKEYNIVDELSITDFDFSKTFNESIEAKVKAEQDALAAKNTLEKVKFEAEQRIAQAKGEAEAIKIQAQAITQQGGKDYVNLQWIKAWEAGGSKVPEFITGENGGNFIFNMKNNQ